MLLLPCVRCVFYSLVGLAIGSAALAQPIEIVPVRDPAQIQSLNGSWKFRYAPGVVEQNDRAFAAPDFNDQAWASLPVPAHWEMHGFAEPKYGKVDAGVGYYRRTFGVPSGWRGQRVMLRFEGVLYGCEVWVNGQRVGEWASSYNPVTFDVTDALETGADNVLAVRVTTRSRGWEFDTNDCWALSGIYRDVALFAVPPTHFQRTSVRTVLEADGRARVQIGAWLAGSAEGARIRGRLGEAKGEKSQAFEIPLNANQGEVSIEVPQPKLWTAETPHLYELELTLERPGQGPQVQVEKIGLRQVTIVDGVLCLNGTPIKLRGVDHHDIWPEEGRAATEALMRRDLELIKAANCNFLRTSHYPAHPRLMELCDELGIYVMDEVPFGFGDEHLKDPSYQEILLTRARATVLRDENRPSVIIWSVGNENPNTPLTFAAGKRVKEIDPSRPICFPQVGSYFAESFEEIPDWVDIYAPHYPNVATVRNYATRLKRPVIFSEYAHALGLATDRIQDEWAVMQAEPRLAGGAVWMFQDQGILRKSEKPVEELSGTPYVWLDPHHYHDTNRFDGMDGIVYSDRTPQTDYWEVRKVYSPVQITATGRPTTSSRELQLEVANRFDFRALTGITLEWSLLRNRETLVHGKRSLQTKAKSTEALKLPIELPKGEPTDFYALSLRCLDEAGHAFYEKVISLAPETTPNRLAALGDHDVSTAPRLEETPDLFRIRHVKYSAELDRRSGELFIRDLAGNLLTRGPLPHTGRSRLTSTEELRTKRDSFWLGATLSHPIKLETSASQAGPDITLRVHAQYPRNDTPEQQLAGGYTATVHANGTIDFAYKFVPLEGKGRMIEAGVSFISAPAATELRWVGTGPYAGYPGKDALNEFGVFHLNREDLSFNGNRRATEVAVLSAPNTGAGLVMLTPPADVAVETTSDGVILSHNALIAGRGNKGVQAETLLQVDQIKEIVGEFSIVPLTTTWPAALTRWVGSKEETVKPFRPFYRSYDQ